MLEDHFVPGGANVERCIICLVPCGDWRSFCDECLRLYDYHNGSKDWMDHAMKERKTQRAVNVLKYGPVNDGR